MSAIEFTYEGRSPSPFGYVDTWEWSAQEAIVNIGGVDANARGIKVVRTRETSDDFAGQAPDPLCDKVTLTMDVCEPSLYDALIRGDSVLAIDKTRSVLHIKDVVTAGGRDRRTMTHVTLIGRIYE